VFFAILAMIVFAFFWFTMMANRWGFFFPFLLGTRGLMLNGRLMTLVPVFLLCVVYVPLIAIPVYRDAAKRGLDPWLWAAVATFVPFLIGVVIYLVVRSERMAVCVNCGKSIRSEFKICPYCGQNQGIFCPQCGKSMAADWKVCPHCGQKLI
jgi:RNA polymerase subunit RPABC4/transcription elongation factor Spt4